MIWFILGMFTGAPVGLFLTACVVAARRGDLQGKQHSDEYQNGYNDGFADGTYEAECRFRG